MNTGNQITLWILVAYFVLNGVAPIALIGKERKPITPGMAAIGVLCSGLIIFGIMTILWGAR